MGALLSIRPILQALAERHGHLTEAEAAALAGLSTTWFRHAFKRTAQISFRSARLQARLGYGASLLTYTSLSINEITIVLGYSDRTKFEKAFKKILGLTPAEYRRSLETTGRGIDCAQPTVLAYAGK